MSAAPALAATPSVLAMPNGAARPLAEVPLHELDAFQRIVGTAPARGRRVSALFAAPDAQRRDGGMALFAVLAADADGVLELLRTELDGTELPSLTPSCPEVHLFERELYEQHGITPVGHPWLKPVRYLHDPIGITRYFAIEGGEVHEVAVGPVHAGVIEPGHFRFQCYGETVLHLEISLGFQHRGVERALVGGPTRRSIHYAETIAGDTTIGHTTAFANVLEALSGGDVPARGQALRAIALELERLANHTGDLGGLAGDIGFLPTAAFCGRLRGEYLNATAELCGSRFGRGLVRPGGTHFDVTAELVGRLQQRLERAFAETDEAARLLWESGSVQSRFEETGRVSLEQVTQLGAVGMIARSSGLHRDVRTTHPSGYYRFAHVPVSTVSSGDVFARAFVRSLEIQRSAEFLRRELELLPDGPTCAPIATPRGEHVAVALVEGWRGEICHVGITDPAGRFATYKIVDPSFHNWLALALALRGQQVSDFPLCNKSFSLSYCGHDL